MRLYSKIYGSEGHELIIIHGLFGMSDNWHSLGKKFSKYYRVHLVDLRNHGRSPHSINFDYEVMCNDIMDYIRDNNIQQPILLGHSLGGKVAMKFAFTYPKEVARLIIGDIAPRKYSIDFHKNLLMKLSRIDLENFTKRSEVEAVLSLFIADAGVRLFLLKNLYRDENQEFAWRFNIDVLLEKLDNIQDDSFLVGICDVSTCFIRGGESNYIDLKDELIIKKHFSDFRIITIDGAGHWLHAEKPSILHDEVIRFCSDM